MKKFVFTSLCVICSILCIDAQVVPNGDFELWSYGKAVGWSADLHGIVSGFFPISVSFGEQSTDAHSGNYAVHLKSENFTVPYMQYNLTLPGILQLGESAGFEISAEELYEFYNAISDTTGETQIDPSNLASLTSLLKLLAPGIPCNSTPAAVSFWAKYITDTIDYFAVFAATKKDGVFVDYTYNTFGPKSQYSQVGVNFNNAGAECDSIMLLVFTSVANHSASELYIDDVELLNTPLSIDVVNESNMAVYPNPTNGVININICESGDYEWEISDLSGKVVKNGTIDESSVIDVSGFNSGMYILKIRGNNMSDTRKILIY